jgi:hypothetical protein
MIVILGLIIFIAAVVVGVAGVLTNSASGHELTGGFSVFGHGMTGSTGTLFLYGIIVGGAALLGLILLLTGARRRSSRRGSVSRRGLRQSRRETTSAGGNRDDLVGRRGPFRAENAKARGNDSPPDDHPLAPHGGRRSKLHLFGHQAER